AGSDETSGVHRELLGCGESGMSQSSGLTVVIRGSRATRNSEEVRGPNEYLTTYQVVSATPPARARPPRTPRTAGGAGTESKRTPGGTGSPGTTGGRPLPRSRRAVRRVSCPRARAPRRRAGRGNRG